MDCRTLFRLDTPVLFLISETQGAGLVHRGRGTWARAHGPREAEEPPHCAPDDPPARLSQPTSASPISSPPRPCSPLLSTHCALATPPPSWGRFQAQSAEPKRRWPDCLQAPGSSLPGSPSFCPSPRQGMRSPRGSGVPPPSKGGRGRKAGFGFVLCVFFSFHVPQWPRHDGGRRSSLLPRWRNGTFGLFFMLRAGRRLICG